MKLTKSSSAQFCIVRETVKFYAERASRVALLIIERRVLLQLLYYSLGG